MINKPNLAPAILATIGWALALYLLPVMLVTSGFSLYAELSHINNINIWLGQIEVLIAMTLAIYALTLPMVLLLASYSASPHFLSMKAAFANALNYLHIDMPSVRQLAQIILLSALFWGLLSLVTIALDVPEEPFMAQIKQADIPIWLIIFIVCLCAPIIEEVSISWLFI